MKKSERERVMLMVVVVRLETFMKGSSGGRTHSDNKYMVVVAFGFWRGLSFPLSFCFLGGPNKRKEDAKAKLD